MVNRGSYEDHNLHRKLGYSTFGVYMTAAGFSVLSPPALKYNKGVSSIKLHRYLSYIHFAGMLCMPYLGYLSAGNMDTSSAEYHTKALNAHRIVGAITFTSLSLSFLTILIPWDWVYCFYLWAVYSQTFKWIKRKAPFLMWGTIPFMNGREFHPKLRLKRIVMRKGMIAMPLSPCL